MDTQTLVSVIIPAYKSAKYLKESLTSIINQSYKNIEVIIVDDTPVDDGTQGIIQAFNDKRIRYYRPTQRLGMVNSLNYAIKESRGKYIARMDADDISHKDRISIQVEYMDANPQVGVLGCNCYTIDEKGKIIGCINHPSNNEDIKSKMMFNVAFIHPSVIMRREILEEDLYNEECYCCEDYELWSRLMTKTEFHNLPQKLFKYRILSDGAMQSQLSRLQKDDEYYRKHTAILKLAYDNVLSYHEEEGLYLSSNYIDMLFAKRIDSVSIKEREKFLLSCMDVLTKKNKGSYVKQCIAYQWLKMSKREFFRAKSKTLVMVSINQIIKKISSTLSARFLNLISASHTYAWRI